MVRVESAGGLMMMAPAEPPSHDVDIDIGGVGKDIGACVLHEFHQISLVLAIIFGNDFENSMVFLVVFTCAAPRRISTSSHGK